MKEDKPKKNKSGLIRKNIDISREAVRKISIKAINEETDFKNLAQKVLEDYSKTI